MGSRSKAPPQIETKVPILTVLIAKDDGRFMARCPELDLVTEMDREEEAFEGMLEMLLEYAGDYRKRIKEFTSSPNRAHHWPYIEKIAACRDKWELRELIGIRYGRVHV